MLTFHLFCMLFALTAGSKELQITIKTHPNLWSGSDGHSATIVGLLYYTNALDKPATQEISLKGQFVQDQSIVFDEILNSNLKEIQGFHIFATHCPVPIQIDNIVFKANNKQYIVAVRQFVGGTIPVSGRTTSLALHIWNQKYHHDWVNHRINFVDPNDRTIHTQSIEATWKNVKQSLKHLCGTSREMFPTYLYQYMFKRSHNNAKIWQHMIFWMGHFYQPDV